MKRLVLSMVALISILAFSFCVNQRNRDEGPESGVAKNIIFLIGDGMGLNQLLAAMTVNHGALNLEQFTTIGLQKTSAANTYITDSGASATALACGQKTNKRAIGVDTLGNDLESILKIAEKNGKSTGMVVTKALANATPAAFIANEDNRYMYEEIAADYLETDIDVAIGGGRDSFTKRKDGRNLVNELRKKGYNVIFSTDSLKYIKSGKVYCLTQTMDEPSVIEGRGDMLAVSAEKAIELLSQNKEGFFLMIEGSLIDRGGHENNQEMVVQETLDLDKVTGLVLDFAKKNGETLVVLTADHETGGMVVLNGDYEAGTVETTFTAGGHTASIIPVFAYGPGSTNFSGIYENTGFLERFLNAYGL